MSPIKLGLPKGSLQESTFALMKRAGWNFKVGSRSYVPSVNDPDIAARLIRPQEIARYVELGLLDAGLTGYDWIYENGAHVVEVAELCYSKATSNPVRWVVAVPNDSPIQSVQGSPGQAHRHRSRRPHHALPGRPWRHRRGRVLLGRHRGQGPRAGRRHRRADRNRLLAARQPLRILDTVLTSTTRLIANQAAWADAGKRAKIEQLALLLSGALNAENKVLLKMNAKKADVAAVSGVLPSLHAPTVNTLSDPSWVAIEPSWMKPSSGRSSPRSRPPVPRALLNLH
jgi:ATP phosphoribosyltransferase